MKQGLILVLLALFAVDARAESISCGGDEPGWSIEVSEGGRIMYSSPNLMAQMQPALPKLVPTSVSARDFNARVIQTKLKNARVTMVITPTPGACEESSGELRDFTAVVVKGSGSNQIVLTGCCEIE